MNEMEKRNILDDPALRSNPFTVKEGYFDALEDAVHARLDAEEQARLNPPAYRKVLAPILGLACMFALIYGMVFTMDRLSFGRADTLAAEVSESETLYQMAQESLSQTKLADYIEEEENLQSSFEDEITTEDIMTYLEETATYDILANLYE